MIQLFYKILQLYLTGIKIEINARTRTPLATADPSDPAKAGLLAR
jgi:hypothetical protein